MVNSRRINSCAETIDKSLVETKGKAFVARMRESLPRLPENTSIVEETVKVGGATAEAVIKICEFIRSLAYRPLVKG